MFTLDQFKPYLDAVTQAAATQAAAHQNLALANAAVVAAQTGADPIVTEANVKLAPLTGFFAQYQPITVTSPTLDTVALAGLQQTFIQVMQELAAAQLALANAQADVPGAQAASDQADAAYTARDAELVAFFDANNTPN